MSRVNSVEEFIHRRFPVDNNWTNGNCYYFAVILKARFPKAIIYYDVLDGHFIVKIGFHFYDWTGKIIEKHKKFYVKWEDMPKYDTGVYARICSGCIK